MHSKTLRIGISAACVLAFGAACSKPVPTAHATLGLGKKQSVSSVTVQETLPRREKDEQFQHYRARVESLMKRQGLAPISAADNGGYKVMSAPGGGAFVSTIAGNDETGTRDGSSTTAQFSYPGSICVDENYNVYMMDGPRLRKITPTGEVTTVAGGDDYYYWRNEPQAPGLLGGGNIVATSAGIVYEADEGNKVIRRIDTNTGETSILAGGRLELGQNGGYSCSNEGVVHNNDGVGSDARFDQPSDIAIGSDGKLYVADRGLFSVRKVDPSNGSVTTITGTPGCFLTFQTWTQDFIDGFESYPVWAPYKVFSPSDGTLYTQDVGLYSPRLTQILPGIEHKFSLPNQYYDLAMDNQKNLYMELGYQLSRVDSSHELRRATRTGGPASV